MKTNRQLAADRKAATNDGDAYMSTVASVEPDIHPIDASAFYASVAISLKRIADACPTPGSEIRARSFLAVGIFIGLIFGWNGHWFFQ